MRIPLALVLTIVLIPALGLAGIDHGQAQPAQLSAVPIWGVVLGTVLVAGLLYLIVHGPDGGYYRYPYYGAYYRHYYRAGYRPYTGFYPASAPVILVAPVIVGTVLGIIVINNLEYILSLDSGGHLYRYPYYGPYRQVYYRPTYRPYHGAYVTNGTYRSAPVRQGDPRWDTDKRNLAPAVQRPPTTPQRPSTPVHQPQQRPSAPAQRPPTTPQRPSTPVHQPQQRPSAPQQPQRPSNASPKGGPGNSSRNSQQPCGPRQEHPCSNTGSEGGR